MVENSEINDRKGLEAWLKDQPREVVIWIASRTAARSLPLYWSNAGNQSSVPFSAKTTIVSLRHLLTSLVSGRAQVGGTTSLIADAGEAASEATSGFMLYSAMDDAAQAMETADSTAHLVDATNAAGAAIHASASAAASLSDIGSGPSPMNVTEALAQAEKAIVYKAFADVVRGTGDMSTQDRWARANAAADEVKGDLWRSVRRDAEVAKGGTLPESLALWQEGHGPLADVWEALSDSLRASKDAAGWSFWIAWYDALLEGSPMLGDAVRTLEMLERIARIEPEVWNGGPEAVNPAIREIWDGYLNPEPASGLSLNPETGSDEQKSTMKRLVEINRDALAISVAGLLEQLATFKERVRGINDLDQQAREDILAFIDEFNGQLLALMKDLPPPGATLNDVQARRLVQWLREYRELVGQKLVHYASPKNMAEATVPTAIVLTATGVGAMMGFPIPGAIVGGLIANQMKPGQAAKELTKPSATESGND